MGKGGAGLSFLNKKTWHPGRMQNQERLWKAEEDAAAEARSLEELRKKIAEERSREDLKEAAVTGGHQKAADRIDWMYSGGMMAKTEADKRNEDAMLGVAPIQENEEDKEMTKMEQATLLPSFYAEDTPVAANETWARLHSDPLFAIRQQEQSARKQVVANPAQMQAIKKQVQTLKDAAAAKKAAKKAVKADKKAEKHAKKQRKAEKAGKHLPVDRAAMQLPSYDGREGRAERDGHGGHLQPPAKRQRLSRSPEPVPTYPGGVSGNDRPGDSGPNGAQQSNYHRSSNGRMHPSDRRYDRSHGPYADDRQHHPRERQSARHDRRVDRRDIKQEDEQHDSMHGGRDRSGAADRDGRFESSRDGAHDRQHERTRDRHESRPDRQHDSERNRRDERRLDARSDSHAARFERQGEEAHSRGNDRERDRYAARSDKRDERMHGDKHSSRPYVKQTDAGPTSRQESHQSNKLSNSRENIVVKVEDDAPGDLSGTHQSDSHHSSDDTRYVSNDAKPSTADATAAGSGEAGDELRERRQRVDGASAQAAGIQYGLTANEHQDADRSVQAAATKERLKAADAARKEADREAKAAMGQRRSHTTGRLTAEEKAAKLEQMTGNAAAHEDSRSLRLRHAAIKDEAIEVAEVGSGRTTHHTDTDRFMKTVTKDVYGAEAGGGTLEERVARRKYYNDRSVGATERNAFRRD